MWPLPSGLPGRHWCAGQLGRLGHWRAHWEQLAVSAQPESACAVRSGDHRRQRRRARLDARLCEPVLGRDLGQPPSTAPRRGGGGLLGEWGGVATACAARSDCIALDPVSRCGLLHAAALLDASAVRCDGQCRCWGQRCWPRGRMGLVPAVGQSRGHRRERARDRRQRRGVLVRPRQGPCAWAGGGDARGGALHGVGRAEAAARTARHEALRGCPQRHRRSRPRGRAGGLRRGRRAVC